MASDSKRVIFNSRDEQFKSPTGAIRSGTEVTFRILVRKDLYVRAANLVVIYDKDNSRAAYPMNRAETPAPTDYYYIYMVKVRIHDTGLYWYSFEMDTGSGKFLVGKSGPDNRAAVSRDTCYSWQQTVYKREYAVPDWIKGGVMYQIFVDRFHSSGRRVSLPGKVLRDDWGGMPEYRPNAEGRILNNDFFGGDLKGITEKLPYLRDLGVTCIYLNPIFEAYSNHKYDTADYMKIDPMFGTLKDFQDLAWKAGEMGIRVILDGVFSHTGSDSRYFDKEHHYGGDGAYNNPDSPYRSWYYFHDQERYETWWGIDTLPRINKENPDYVNFICGEDGVARYWLRNGASGWRLDVVDELPSSFVVKLAEAIKEERSDAYLVGEVWEDASNKIAYSERKNYFSGDKLDAAMNYPFKNAIIDFVRNGNAFGIMDTVETIMENYPKDVIDCLMNILGTHDTERILTALGGKDLGFNPDRETQANTKMSPEERERAVRLLKIASALQMTLPGIPCIYYGDEVGMEGYKDPFNRRCYPWGHEDQDLLKWYRYLISFRKSHAVFRDGGYRTVAAISGVYGFERYNEEERIVTAANCGSEEMSIMLSGTWVNDVTGEMVNGNVTVFPEEVLLLREMRK
ncbi:MAG: glycoside hydrolase family 13 protein [Anaerovoracaceae bacterium]|jgi:cyclomaltodextrinase